MCCSIPGLPAAKGYGPVTMGSSGVAETMQHKLVPTATKAKAKDDPVTVDKVKEALHQHVARRDRALEDLRKVAERRSVELKAKKLAAEAGAKYEELSGKGLTQEEAEEMVYKALEANQ